MPALETGCSLLSASIFLFAYSGKNTFAREWKVFLSQSTLFAYHCPKKTSLEIRGHEFVDEGLEEWIG